MTATGTDVVVIGGGIVGTSAAAFLAEAGATVTLVERDGLASGASGANSGIVQHPFDPILAALYRETVGLYRELTAADVGFRLGAEPAGLIYVSADEAAVRAVDRSLADAFPELERVVAGGTELQAIEPAIAPGVWGCLVGIGYPVAPAASTYAYATIAERRGVRVRAGRTAALDRRGETVVGVVVDGISTAADAVLVAAGPGSPAVVDPTGGWLPIRARWGVVVETELPTGPAHILEEAEIGAAIGTGSTGVADDEPRRPSQPGAARRGRRDRVDVPRARTGTGGLDRADPHPGEHVRPGRDRRADPGDARVRTAAEHGRPAADRAHRGDARPVHLRRPRRLGDLDRAGLGADGGRRDARQVSGHPGRARSGQVRERQPGSTTMTSSRRGPWTPSTRWSSMSLVADGPLIQVCGRTGSRRASASGTVPTTCSARTTQTWRSGSRLSARRPWSGPASSTIVPVSAIATAQPVTTPSRASRSAEVRRRLGIRDRHDRRRAASHADGRSAGTAMRPAPWPASTAATTPGRPAVVVRWTVAR